MAEKKLNDAGVGASARAGLRVYEHAARGSGRTHQMIMALPEGAVVFCSNSTGWLRNMIRDLRGPQFQVTVVACNGLDGIHRGLVEHRAKPGYTPIAVDHHLIYMMYEQALDHLERQLAALGSPPHPFSEHTQDVPPVMLFTEMPGRRSDG